MTTFNSANATPAAVSELVSATKETNLQEPIVASIDSGPVQAYAKLEGDDFCYYIRTLQVSLGRKVTNPENVDIPLGNTKSVSRQHARLFYNFSTQRFELMVFGKNGAFVNEQFIERGVTVPLDNKTKIQIGEMAFVFLLPKSNTDTVNTTNNASPHHNDNNFGYISTPHQLEKNIKNTSPPTQSQESEDYDMSDDGSESSGPNPYSNKDIKPPYSYASLIAQAINSSKDKRMTLNGIYNYITTNYPYYQMAQNGWQNSIRHNLSLNKAFVKVPRGETEPGKGAFWTIDINAETQFTNGVYKRNKRSGSITHSENVKKKSKKDTTVKAIPDSDNSEEEEDELIDDDEEKLLISAVKEEQNDDETTQSLLVANAIVKETETVPLKEKEIIPVKVTDEKKDVIIEPITTPIVSTVPTAGTISNDPTIQATNTNNNQEAQAQLQLQLQNTIRQHLLDPIRYPLPPSIAQLLPQAIAQLPPQLATQLSSTLQTSIKVTEASAVAIPDTENDAKNTIVESEK